MTTEDAVKISVQNLSTALTDEEAKAIAAALESQAISDFNSSCWVGDDHCVPVGSVTFVPKGDAVPPDTWHLELLDTSDQPGALGYHEEQSFDSKVDGREAAGEKDIVSTEPRKASRKSSRGLRADAPHLPLMKIFAKTSKEDGAQTSEVASHEMLEALVDPAPMVNPKTVTNTEQGRIYIVEVGDPVQESGYEINGVLVANFTLPHYYGLPQSSNPTQYDWRSVLTSGAPAMTPDAYISWAPTSDPEAWQQSFGSATADASV